MLALNDYLALGGYSDLSLWSLITQGLLDAYCCLVR